MIEKLKKNKMYIKYGVFIIFIAIIVVLTIKTITYGEVMVSFVIVQFKRFLDIISPIIYAILLAYLLYEPMKFIEKNIYKIINDKRKEKYSKLIRLLSILLVFLLVILGLVLIYNFLIPPIINNVKDVVNSLPEVEKQMREWFSEIISNLSNKNITVESAGNLSGDIVNKVGLMADKILNVTINVVSGLSSFVVNFIVTIILTIYFLIDKERLVYQMKRLRDVLLPYKVGRALTIFLLDLDNIVGRFIVGEILDSVIVGVVSTILLLIIRHPFAVLIGVIAGVTNIIPYIGPVIGAALAFFFGIFTSLPLGIIGAILLLLYQQIDGNFVQPKIVGDKIGLSPVWILIAVLIGGSYFGPIGMILSMPVAGLLKVYFNRYSEYKKRSIYSEEQ
ncbi:MAG: AI-2E family transporter [Clostridium sp.]|nr:AI-2E family transporter [Clostridium sp.]